MDRAGRGGRAPVGERPALLALGPVALLDVAALDSIVLLTVAVLGSVARDLVALLDVAVLDSGSIVFFSGVGAVSGCAGQRRRARLRRVALSGVYARTGLRFRGPVALLNVAVLDPVALLDVALIDFVAARQNAVLDPVAQGPVALLCCAARDSGAPGVELLALDPVALLSVAAPDPVALLTDAALDAFTLAGVLALDPAALLGVAVLDSVVLPSVGALAPPALERAAPVALCASSVDATLLLLNLFALVIFEVLSSVALLNVAAPGSSAPRPVALLSVAPRDSVALIAAFVPAMGAAALLRVAPLDSVALGPASLFNVAVLDSVAPLGVAALAPGALPKDAALVALLASLVDAGSPAVDLVALLNVAARGPLAPPHVAAIGSVALDPVALLAVAVLGCVALFSVVALVLGTLLKDLMLVALQVLARRCEAACDGLATGRADALARVAPGIAFCDGGQECPVEGSPPAPAFAELVRAPPLTRAELQ
ncbi:unnamed protein product [Prorocentrum cordatum]|uniref:Uncharacterized protein n=1 Tax=Prorocentrum cordatum TaxID=2364126 RepID=A0ABN9VL97_9DINO|nr:unnamed protein product [Polarella glacialis]